MTATKHSTPLPRTAAPAATGSQLPTAAHRALHSVPLVRLVVGLVMNAVAWVSAWTQLGPLAHYNFLFLWTGFILVIDAATEARSGTSLWRRGRAQFVALFLVSAPFWWYFERLNTRTGNWHYLTWRHLSDVEYVFWATLAFSTVIPAVLAVAELLCTFFPRDDTPVRTEPLPGRLVALVMGFGVLTLALSLLLPRYFFPFLWASLVFLLDPLNGRYGEPSILAWARQGAWRGTARLMAAGLICGVFWEMWNYFSNPKWFYTVPFVDFLHVFEMPLLGFLGYLPFALEIFAVYHFVRLMLRRTGFFPADYVRV